MIDATPVPEPPADLAKATVLIVDDNAVVRETIGGVLEGQGYDLIYAENGPEALARAAEQPPDIILLDVMMPGMDGFDVCRRLRADPHLAGIPIVFVTALDDRDSRLRGLELGADDFLSKPIDWAELRARVHNITRLNRYRTLLNERAAFEQTLRAKNRQLQELSWRLVEAQEVERRFVAAELHDDVGQALTALKLMLEMAAQQPETAREANLQDAQALLAELSGRIRNLSLDLRPAMLDDFGLFAALEWLFERFTQQTRVRVAHNFSFLDERRFPRPIETAAFRIIQEALTNVARHAQTQGVEVSIVVTPEAVRLRVKDEGVGFELADDRDGYQSGGLSGMRERANLLGGQLTIRSTPGAGTEVSAELPLTGIRKAGRVYAVDSAHPGG
jgi:signal transduction histidine kinase